MAPRARLVLALSALLDLLAACAHSPPLPVHTWAGPEEAMSVLRERAAAIHTLQSSARLVLTRPDGQTVHLDAALVAQFPDHLRLRAWKLGQAVFDLTYTPEGLWLLTGRDTGDKGEGLSVSTAGFARAWSLFTPDFFSAPLAEVLRGDGPVLLVQRRSGQGSGGSILCEVDRPTLTPRRYTVLDDTGAARSTLTLDRYRDFDGLLWPTSIQAASESGTVMVFIDSARFNEGLPEAAFNPPVAAVKQP
jgi:hypothetical protein